MASTKLHDRLEEWFHARDWSPFAFQRETWEAYAQGRSLLLHAPTGMGKTYAVWLGPLSEYLDGLGQEKKEAETKKAEPLRVVWLTPLRALAADTVESLLDPVRELGANWTVEQRTGDTSASVRARQDKRMPTALVTTPESLSVMLSRKDARKRLSTVRCVIVDEWHELLSTKRGTQTELCLARLRAWNPEIQTLGLSATLGNLDEALRALTGSVEQDAEPVLVKGDDPKEVVVESVLPSDITRFPWAGHLGIKLSEDVAQAIDQAGTTLVFCNTRSQCEIWFAELFKRRPDWLGRIAIHHGSIDRELRTRVENALRTGQVEDPSGSVTALKCVVCTSSLDLGVDFSPVDQVIQIGSPKGVARLIQRAGRSGHAPGKISRVLCVPAHAFELVEFAAARTAIGRKAIESRVPLAKPLDVLAQHAVTLAVGEGFDAETLFEEVRTTHAYRELTDEEWGWVLEFITTGGSALTAYPHFHRVV
ncbi:MAG: DEAD/DEAH box helicase, partial [Planctomycetota bacterium]